MIDYTKIIINVLAPRLAYHGLKYSDEKSQPAMGYYCFTRNYWGKSQHISVSRVEYNLEQITELIGQDDDIPTEVPEDQAQIRESGYRLWLSNRYITVMIAHEGGGISLTRAGLGSLARDKDWQFRTEAELRQVLREITDLVLTKGLDWLDEQVADIRRHHEKLDARRHLQKQREKHKRQKDDV